MKYEIEDLVNQLIRIEKKITVLLMLEGLYVDSNTLEIKEIEKEENKKEAEDDEIVETENDDIQIKEK